MMFRPSKPTVPEDQLYKYLDEIRTKSTNKEIFEVF